jgi:LmbE family N-acetylglucosaminyl deacetylase
MSSPPLDILAIAAHRDDVEQTCGGTLLKMAQRGQRAGILDLTQGEMGTRGTAKDRAREAAEAAKILCISWRHALDIPDGRVENTWHNRLKVARLIREQRPRVVILPYWQGRHPDHYTASTLGYEACFLAGLRKLDDRAAVPAAPPKADRPGNSPPDAAARESIDDALTRIGTQGLDSLKSSQASDRSAEESAEDRAPSSQALPPHRPFKIIYATLYYDVRPTFVVDITGQFEARFQSLMAYKSQFTDQDAGKEVFPAQAEIRSRIEAMARYYGLLAGVTYAEPFLQKEVGLVEDLTLIPVKSI